MKNMIKIALKITVSNILSKALLSSVWNVPRRPLRSALQPFHVLDRLHERSMGVFDCLMSVFDRL
jgi:hypothetical protein